MRIEKELDIVRFIKRQKYLSILLQLLLNNDERYLLKKNKRFLLSGKDYLKEDSSLEEDHSIKRHSITSPRMEWLLQDAFWDSKKRGKIEKEFQGPDRSKKLFKQH